MESWNEGMLQAPIISLPVFQSSSLPVFHLPISLLRAPPAPPMIDFSQLDPVIHEKGRLSIMTLLAARGPWSFQELKGGLEMSDGNLITHLRTLTKAGYIRETRTTARDSGRPRTNYEITAAGSGVFKAYLKVLEAIVKHGKPR